MALKEFIKKNRILLSIIALASLAIVAVAVFAIPVFPGVFTGLVAALKGFPVFSAMFTGAAKISYGATVATACAIVGGLVAAMGFLLVGFVSLTQRCLDKVGSRSLYERIPPETNEVQPSPMISRELPPSTVSSVLPRQPSSPLASTPEVVKIIREAEECIQTHKEEIVSLPVVNQAPPSTPPVFPKKGQPTLFSSVRLAKSEERMSDDKIESPTLPARS